VDLPGLLNSGDLESFKYFYLIFRREAFGHVVDGGSFLDRVREGSVAYAQEIGEDLQENVYRAMKILAEGLLAEAGTDIASSEIENENQNENDTILLSRRCRRTPCDCSTGCCSYSMLRAEICWTLIIGTITS
jgi:hypothetical protein